MSSGSTKKSLRDRIASAVPKLSTNRLLQFAHDRSQTLAQVKTAEATKPPETDCKQTSTPATPSTPSSPFTQLGDTSTHKKHSEDVADRNIAKNNLVHSRGSSLETAWFAQPAIVPPAPKQTPRVNKSHRPLLVKKDEYAGDVADWNIQQWSKPLPATSDCMPKPLVVKKKDETKN